MLTLQLEDIFQEIIYYLIISTVPELIRVSHFETFRRGLL